MSDFILLFVWGLVSLIIIINLSYIIGKIITTYSLISVRTKYGNIFLNTTLGLFTLISIEAIIGTYGRTILIVPLFIILINILYNIKSKKVSNLQISLKDFYSYKVLTLIALLSFIIFYFRFINIFSGEIVMPLYGADYVRYGLIAKSMVINHIETKFLNYLDKSFLFPSIFHYGDIWNLAIFSHILGINAYFSYVVLCAALWNTISLFGILAVIEFFIPVKWWHYIIAMSLYFIAPVTFFQIYEMLHLNVNAKIYGMGGYKYLFITIITLGLLYSLILKNWKLHAFIIILTIFYYTALAPTIIIYSFAIFFWLFITKQITFKSFVIKIGMISFLFIGLLLYYKAVSPETNDVQFGVGKEGVINIIKSLNISEMLRVLTTYIIVIDFVMFLVPVLIIIVIALINMKRLLEFIKSYKNEILFPILLIGSGALAFILLLPETNSDQLWSLFNVIISSISLIFLIVFLLHKHKLIGIGFIIIYFVFHYELIVPRFTESLNKYLHYKRIPFSLCKEIKNKIGNVDFIEEKAGFLTNYFDKNNIHSKNIGIYRPLPFILFVNDTYIPVALLVPEFEKDNKYMQYHVKLIEYYNYLKKHNLQDSDTTKYRFMKENNMKYLIVHSSYKLPDIIEKEIRDTLLSIGEWKFFVLNP